MAEIFISCFPIFPPNMSGISAGVRGFVQLGVEHREGSNREH